MTGARASRVGLVAALALSACAAEAPSAYLVTETSFDAGARVGAPLPAIEVRRTDGTALTREDWTVAEAAARDHCAARGAGYDRLPPARDYTQMRLEEGVFTFLARCTG
ncbi:hypothetical protein [Roseicyclus persicicus]|uniref:Lipoprotein n=1 Tax=Roseicyclus persicicus TaxID=2650661 RepID=A0A7X6GXW2_9RHOB|nr:hypothetical protein [Roseibacterium persicicum]NKX44343.1 hypothetical protein [Roseibacterium persicicum]